VLALSPNEVHVWRAELDLAPERVSVLERTLAPDELARANRFRFSADRVHFIVGRGALRDILGRYLGLAPERVRFSYLPRGKPVLAELSLQFNLAHSGGVALYAVARGRRVGVDVERIRPDVPCEKLAARFFSPHEQEQLRALPAEARVGAFFACWTRKEAYVKARGDGLALGLSQFAVSLAPGEPASLVETAFDPAEAGRWSLREIEVGPGYVAALAVEGQGWRLAGWEWPERTTAFSSPF
jgi:4'-phosphopantetheinyl transferase